VYRGVNRAKAVISFYCWLVTNSVPRTEIDGQTIKSYKKKKLLTFPKAACGLAIFKGEYAFRKQNKSPFSKITETGKC
jgi:hypothetical protein